MLNNKKNRGAVSVIIVILIMSILLVIALGVSILMFQQMKMSKQIGKSVTALYAAQAVAEECLFHVFNKSGECYDTGQISGSFNLGDAGTVDYSAQYNGSDQIFSGGKYKGVSRAFKLDLTP